MFKKVILLMLFLVVGIASMVPNSQAVILDEALDRHWIKEADLIILGKISEIRYAMSSKETEEDLVLPHTFVTIAIEETYKGNAAEQRQVTLRFQGGMGEEEGSWLQIMGSPQFDLGDYGVFFIKNNGNHICPLVGWRQGFMRIIGDEIVSDFGNSLILTDDPILAARIHPRDIRSFDQFKERMLKPQSEFDSSLVRLLSRETIALIESPESLNQLDPDRLKYIPANLEIEAKEELGEIFAKLLPMEFRHIPRSYAEAMLFRDLNLLLLRRNLVNSLAFTDLKLPEELQEQIRLIPQLPLEEVVLINRRIFEAAYPMLLTKSLDETIVKGQWKMYEEIMTQQRGEEKLVMRMVTPEEREGPNPDAKPEFDGRVLSPGNFIERVAFMIDELHTPEELRALPAVQSANPDQPFFFRNPLTPVQVVEELRIPDKQLSDIDAFELEMLRESGGNPVLKR